MDILLPWFTIKCAFCRKTFQARRVTLLRNKVINDCEWFKHYACPTCKTKGAQSTRREEGRPIHQTPEPPTNG
ncbi:unnamed protein product, partial [Ectocarpus fasciculatus]